MIIVRIHFYNKDCQIMNKKFMNKMKITIKGLIMIMNKKNLQKKNMM